MTATSTMDTRPIPLENLTTRARVTLRKVLDRLNEFRYDNQVNERERATPPRALDRRGPWAPIDPGRSYRVIMLDGPRGTGKTSLMLTLIAHWNRAGRDRPAVEPSEGLDPLFRDKDVGVRALTPLDFDPHPRHIHPYAWLVLGFQHLVDWLDKRGRGCVRRDGDEESLQCIWYKLYEQALIGWDSEIQRKRMTTDLDEFIASSLDSHRGWQQLRAAWGGFFDRLLTELEEHREIGQNDLIVLPIDDLDLQPDLAGDLLRAIRLMHHPRLVFLLTGHYQHLHEVLTRELMPKNPIKPEEEEVRKTRRLAAEIIDKSIPASERFPVPLLTLGEAFSFVTRKQEKHEEEPNAETIVTYLDGFDRPKMLARWISRSKAREYRYRDVTQIRRDNGLEAEGSLNHLTKLCLRTPFEAGRFMFSETTGGGTQHTFKCETEVWIRLNPHYEVRLDTTRGVSRAEPRILVATSLDPVVEAENGKVLVPEAVAVMAYLHPGDIAGVSLGANLGSGLMVTDWTTGPRQLPEQIAWPMARQFRSLEDVDREQQALVTNAKTFSERGVQYDEARFIAWCMMNFGLPESEVQIPGILDVLEQGLEPLKESEDVENWVDLRLPILAAPEYGLPNRLATRMLNWVMRRTPLQLAPFETEWRSARRQALIDAFERSRSTRGPKSPVARAEAALAWLEEHHRAHPWYRFIQRQEAVTRDASSSTDTEQEGTAHESQSLIPASLPSGDSETLAGRASLTANGDEETKVLAPSSPGPIPSDAMVPTVTSATDTPAPEQSSPRPMPSDAIVPTAETSTTDTPPPVPSSPDREAIEAAKDGSVDPKTGQAPMSGSPAGGKPKQRKTRSKSGS